MLVVPVYKEEKILERNVIRLEEYLKQKNINFDLVLSIDDSGDKSIDIGRKLEKEYENIHIIEHKRKMGRGFAVREAWSKYDADLYAFIDADLAMNIDVITTAYNVISKENLDGIIASRYVDGSQLSRPKLREIISKIYNVILRIIFNDDIMDHQCGFKMISKNAKDKVLNLTKISSWFWDAELVIIMNAFKMKIKEYPVLWVENKYKKTSLKRLLNDVIIHGYGIAYLYIELHRIKKGMKNG
ncbi:MAG: glycosyltransferase [Thermoplasmata archaeon]